MKNIGIFAAVAALIGSAACSNKSQTADAALKADLAAAGGAPSSGLELAPSAGKSQVVMSAIEGGPKAAPAPAARQRTPAPSPRPTVRVAEKQAPAPTPAPEPMNPVVETVSAPAPAQRPAPIQGPAPREDHRVYKTEAEVFRQMPWIKP